MLHTFYTLQSFEHVFVLQHPLTIPRYRYLNLKCKVLQVLLNQLCIPSYSAGSPIHIELVLLPQIHQVPYLHLEFQLDVIRWLLFKQARRSATGAGKVGLLPETLSVVVGEFLILVYVSQSKDS